MDECIGSLVEAAVFSMLDANKYCQIEIENEDLDRTATTSHHGLNRIVQMSFEPRNAPSTFQRDMNVVLSAVNLQISLIHLDERYCRILSLDSVTHRSLDMYKCIYATQRSP